MGTNPNMRDMSEQPVKPIDSRIQIIEAGNAVTVHIPRPRMPLIIYLAIALSAMTLMGAFFAGLMIFVVQRPFPLFESLIGGTIQAIPAPWKWFGVTAWVALIVTGAVPLVYAVKPLARAEAVVFGPDRIDLRESFIGRGAVRCIAYRDAGEFRDRRDPSGLLESELVLLLNRPMLDGGGDEIEIAKSTSELEKEWLAHELNLILSRVRNR
jgi:hypothetical protein